jgi:hypothetical protein
VIANKPTAARNSTNRKMRPGQCPKISLTVAS